MTTNPFHGGELEAQQRAGVRSMAAKVGHGIHRAFPPAAAAFLEQARLVAVATTDEAGRPWASVLTGEPGFVSVPDPASAVIAATPPIGDPLNDHLVTGRPIGLLAPDFATRRRMRLNGTIGHAWPGAFMIEAEQVFANCPKYIQKRVTSPVAASHPVAARTGASLDDRQREWLRRADTFFVATANPGEGADASHRGGRPGFIRVDGDRLRWPDYSGNMMFNTIGNVLVHPWAGIAVPDFTTGDLLLLSGAASVDWSPTPEEAAAGAERVMQLDVDRVVELGGALPLRAEWVEMSPFNPPGR